MAVRPLRRSNRPEVGRGNRTAAQGRGAEAGQARKPKARLRSGGGLTRRRQAGVALELNPLLETTNHVSNVNRLGKIGIYNRYSLKDLRPPRGDGKRSAKRHRRRYPIGPDGHPS